MLSACCPLADPCGSLDEQALLAKQLIHAVVYLHEQGMVVRNLSAANVRLDAQVLIDDGLKCS